MRLIDTHAHLFWDSYKSDFDQVLQRAKESGVKTIINVGVDVSLSQVALDLESKTSEVKFYSTIGIHPHEAAKYVDNQLELDIKKLEQIYRSNPKKVIGVGECGLDYFFNNNPDYNPSNLTIEQLKQLQKKLFQVQIDLAKKLDLPLIIHCRDDRSKNPENVECWEECLEMIKGYKGILHCYSGNSSITKQTMNHEFANFLVSFAGNITYPKNEYLRQAIKDLPLEKICLETDCPFLAPQSIRGERNEPKSIKEIAELIAKLKGVTLEKVALQTTQNIKSLFNLSL